MDKSIEIVTHCYAVEYPHYAACLCYQLSSLVSIAGTDIRVTICYCEEDKRTNDVVEFFAKCKNLRLKPIKLTRDEFSRRSIGRNKAALKSEADIVWFADCDQVFRDGIMGKLSKHHWPWDVTLIYPAEIMIQRDHETGDQALAKIPNPCFIGIDPSEFVPKRYMRAIGGVQIVRGDFARRFGYLKDTKKWQTPNEVVLGDFRDDIAYRKFCYQLGKIERIDLTGMYRMRHSTTSYQ